MLRILLTNDDGIDAPGLATLWDAVQLACESSIDSAPDAEICVLAPDRGRSECGHSVSNATPLTVQEVRPSWYSLSGTPVECVRAALASVFPNPDVVISGINAGANLGVDLLVSGTFAAAREAACHGVPALAISHYRRPDVPKTWEHAAGWSVPVIKRFVQTQIDQATPSDHPLWNLNLPAIDPTSGVPPLVDCFVDPCPVQREGHRDGQDLRFNLDFHARPRKPGSDVDHCFGGKMTLSRLPFRVS